MLTIEHDEPHISECKCCGRPVTIVTSYVYEDGEAYAAYYVRFTPGHAPRHVQALISLGAWGDDTGPWDRVAFPLEIEEAPEEFRVRLVEREESPWQEAEVMGRLLSRDESRAHERLQEVFHITDHMVVDDIHLRRFFSDAT
jgi:hypothetical protein